MQSQTFLCFSVFLFSLMSWFNPSQQLSTTQLLAHSPTGGMGERIGRVKVRKFMGWDKDNLIGKAKAAHASKARNSFPTSHGQAGVQPSSGKQGSIMHNSYLGRQTPSLRTSSSSFFFLQLYMLSMMSYGTEYPFGQLGSAVPAVSPRSFLCTPNLLAGGVRSSKGLDSE